MEHDYSSAEFESEYTYHGNDLGAVWSPERTCFKVWAPTAASVSVFLYQSGNAWENDRIREIKMEPDKCGTWTVAVDGNLNGIYYTYSVLCNGIRREACDPYAVAAGVNGVRAMVIDLNSTNPEGWENDTDPHYGIAMTDMVLYELHIRDLSSAPHCGIKAKGKYAGVTETGTKTRSGYATGLDHMKDLGITHIHFLPMYDYGSVDETQAHPRQYNWGYDPANYNVPEGSYAKNPFDGAERIKELKQMIQSLHKQNISVIMDVVYNHIYHTDDFGFNRIVPGYFYRTDAQGKLSNGSGCGNDTASERSMVHKYIVDSVKYWADEYHIDGFRFDILGLIDTDTIQDVIRTVRKTHPNVVFYGEGWDIPTCVTKPGMKLAIQRNSNILPEMGFFNDSIRDALKGNEFDPHGQGFATGAVVSPEHMLELFCSRVGWTNQPAQVINYVSCHDNPTLYDRIATVLPYVPQEEWAKRSRLAAAFNLLSCGVPFFQAGEELLRSKKTKAGKYVANSYKSSDYVNSIKWDTLADPEVQKTLAYYKGILAIRKAFPCFRMDDPKKIREQIRLYRTGCAACAAFELSEETRTVLAVFNSGWLDAQVRLPYGKWAVLAREDTAGLDILEEKEGLIHVAPLSLLLLVQEK